jgi:Family of unknown function (DUF5947)
MIAGALERIVRQAGARRAEAQEHCDLCSLPVPTAHRHMVEVDTGGLLCACRACALLFDRTGAANGRYLLIPEVRRRVDAVSPAQLGVPVGLAYFVVERSGRVQAHYPSPAGATRWEVDGAAWREAVARCPQLETMARDVEALLVNTAKGHSEAWVVPLDDCFRLAGIVREHWRGLSGGSRVWEEINAFFDAMRRHDGSDPSR